MYCSDGIVAYWNGGKVYSAESLPVKARARIMDQLDPLAVGQADGAGMVASWSCDGDGAIDAAEIISVAYPEIPPSAKALSYHLGFEGPPAQVVGLALTASLSIIARLGRLRDLGLPQWLSHLAGRDPPPCQLEEGTVIVTDNPRASCPTWSPLYPRPERVPRGTDPRVVVAVESLSLRRGDWRQALEWARLREWGGSLREAIEKSLSPAGDPPVEGGFQVRPSDARYARLSRYRVSYECSRPLVDCALEAGLKPGKPPRVRFEVHQLSQALRGVHEAVAAVIRDWPLEGRGLVVVPSRLAARIAGESLELRVLDEPWSVDSWGSGWAVIAWEDLLSMPWTASHAENIVLVYPEAYPGAPQGASRAREWLQWMASQYSGRLVSRLAYNLAEGLVGGGEIPRVEARVPRREWILEEARRAFSRHWGGLSLRPYQEEIIAAIVEMGLMRPGQPVYVILPTGSGKSAIFQVAGQVLKGLGLGGYTLVVSPLRALMRDQVEGARRRGFRAGRVDASVSGGKRRLTYREASMGLLDVVYVTPERFMDEGFTKLLVSSPPALAVLDEAHTLARWGPSFRPAYLHAARLIADLRSTDGWPPVAFFTATSPPETVAEVLGSIGSSPGRIVRVELSSKPTYEWPETGALVFQGPVIREEISFTVEPAPEGEERVEHSVRVIEKLSSWARSVSDPWVGVVYTGYVKRTRKVWENADELAEMIAERTGIRALSYHGQLPAGERRRREDEIYKASSEGPPLIVVATKAFGMGVDIPNIRWVLHFTASESIEDYYQEVGRAGRDGKPAIAYTLYNSLDFEERLRLVRAQRTTPSIVATTYNTIYNLWARIRKETGGSPEIVLPREAIHPDPVNMKALNTLQSLGYLDYWGVRGTLTAYKFHRGEDPSDYLPWYMDLGGRIVVGPREKIGGAAEELSLQVYKCKLWSEHRPLAIIAGDKKVETGECKDPVRVSTSNTGIVVVNMSLDRDHAPIRVFPPVEYAHIVRGMWSDEEKLESLRSLLEQAIAYRKSPEEQDRIVKEGIRRYFEAQPLHRPGDPPGVLGTRMACPSLWDCLEDLASVVKTVSDWLGQRAVTLAVQDEDKAGELVRRLSGILEAPFQGRWKGAYRRVVNASRKGPLALMDHGFIVAVLRATGRKSILIDRLEGYPYHALFMYSRA